MAVLNRDDFFSRINEIIGSRTDEDSIRFIEDMSDTYTDFERRVETGADDWERRYHELDQAWKEKYKKRFFSGVSDIPDTTIVETSHEKKDFSDLFD